MSPENMDSFAEVLKSKKDPRKLKLLLRIIKRLVSWLLNIFEVRMFLLYHWIILGVFFSS